MEGPLRSIVAGVAAWKLGGGCLSTIAIFLIVFYLLGFVKCQFIQITLPRYFEKYRGKLIWKSLFINRLKHYR